MNGAGFRQYVDGVLQGLEDIDAAISRQAPALKANMVFGAAAEPLTRLAALYVRIVARLPYADRIPNSKNHINV
jgi:hypothetical protein